MNVVGAFSHVLDFVDCSGFLRDAFGICTIPSDSDAYLERFLLFPHRFCMFYAAYFRLKIFTGCDKLLTM